VPHGRRLTQSILHSTPYTLHPTPYTLTHPKHPQPSEGAQQKSPTKEPNKRAQQKSPTNALLPQLPSPLSAQADRMVRLLPATSPAASVRAEIQAAEATLRTCNPAAADSMAFVSKVC